MVLGTRTRALVVKALGYARGAPTPLSLDDKAFRECIVWLEDTKIRALPMAGRGPLRTVDAPPSEWIAAFSAFAREVGCVLDAATPQNTERVFDYLLEQAIALDYRDNAENLGAVVKDLKMATISTNASGGGIPPPSKRQRVAPPQPEERELMEGLSDPALRSHLFELAALLKVDAEEVMRSGGGDGGGGVEALVDACVRAVERFIAPFWMSHVDSRNQNQNQNQGRESGGGANGNGGGGGGGGKGGKGGSGRGGGARGSAGGGGGGRGGDESAPAAASWNLKITDFPSGIALGGAGDGGGGAVEAAVNVLRVLHVNDLRMLQSTVDALLVQMQEYTSDPKTDSRLGRVGTG